MKKTISLLIIMTNLLASAQTIYVSNSPVITGLTKSGSEYVLTATLPISDSTKGIPRQSFDFKALTVNFITKSKVTPLQIQPTPVTDDPQSVEYVIGQRAVGVLFKDPNWISINYIFNYTINKNLISL